MAQLNITNIGYTSVNWYISGLERDWNTDNYYLAGIANKPVTDGQTDDPVTIPGFDWWEYFYAPSTGTDRMTPTGFVTGFGAGLTYTGYGIAQANVGGIWHYYNAGSRTFTMQNSSPRPPRFSWTYAKNQGHDFNLRDFEWNGLTDNIAEVHKYKIGWYPGFDDASQGLPFYASMYRQAVYWISEMFPFVPAPPNRYTDDDIRADDLNRLVNSINSIS